MDVPTPREAALAAEVAQLRQLLAEAGLQAGQAATSASAVSDAHMTSLAESQQETRVAREDTRQTRQAADQAAAEHRTEMATHHAVVGNGHLDPGMQLITKPLSLEAVANRIRSMINRG